ncbi:MAG: OmpH family outer membrane protein [Acidobacteriota bacterium]|jgi:Skp family chaperone for outer membrane proteins|nr:OmpH family outer membrane protein [Acidobacteriota bacterium]
MKVLRFTVVSLFIVGLFTISALAQTQPTVKIGVIDTRTFAADKGGITKYVAEQTKLNNEFKPVNQQLTALITKINALKQEISNLQESKAPVKPETITVKAEEHDKLVRELKFKQEDAKAKLAARSKDLLAPVTQDIYKAMQEFADKNGYTMIMDAAQLDQAGLVLAFDRKYDVTDEFVKFYNTRPPGTAGK